MASLAGFFSAILVLCDKFISALFSRAARHMAVKYQAVSFPNFSMLMV